MKHIANIFILGLIPGLFTCNSATGRPENVSDKSISMVSISLTERQNIGTKDQSPTKNCARGKAVPVIKKVVYPRATFVLQPDSLTGIETLNFDNGDKLIIKNWGCEYYVLTFRFETFRFQQNPENLEFWFRNVVVLVTEMLSGLDAPVDIKKGITELKNYIDSDQPNKSKNLKPGKEIDFGGNDIRSFVSVDRIEKLTDKKYAIEITFATGPL